MDWLDATVTRDEAEKLLLRILGDFEEAKEDESQTEVLVEALADPGHVHATLTKAGPSLPRALHVGQLVRLADILSVIALRGGDIGTLALDIIDHAYVEVEKWLAAHAPEMPSSALGSQRRIVEDNVHRHRPHLLIEERQEYRRWRESPPGEQLWVGAGRIAWRLLGYWGSCVIRGDEPALVPLRDEFDEPLFLVDIGQPHTAAVWACLHDRLDTAFIEAPKVDARRLQREVARQIQSATLRRFLEEQARTAPPERQRAIHRLLQSR